MLTEDQLVESVPYLLGMAESPLPVTHTSSDVSQFINSYVSESLMVSVTEKEIHLTREIDPNSSENTVQKLCVLIKDKGQVTSVDQIQSIVLPMQQNGDSDVFNKLRAILNLGLLPIFETTSVHKTDSDSFIQATRKKFNELSASLQNLQEKVSVPNLLLSVHPVIKQFEAEQDTFDETILNDANTLNEITNIVNGWNKQIQAVTELSSNLDNRTSIVDEIQFWNSMEISLGAIEDQLKSPYVKNSMNLLNRAKRFHVTLSFTNDTNLSNKVMETKMNLSLLKDLPIDDLLGINAKDPDALAKFNDSVSVIFNHLKRLRSIPSFPLEKALLLTELILKDIVNKFSELSGAMNLLTLDVDEFTDVFDTHISEIFANIDLNIKYMVNLIRELLRKRQEKFIIVRINQDSIDMVKERLESLRGFRLNHENLLFITRNFLHDVDQETKLIDEYNRLAVLNPLDFSKHGEFNWSTSEKLYASIHHNIQSQITKNLNDLFSNCKQFKDYVLVTEKYKYLKIENTFDFSLLMREDLRLKILETANEEVKKVAKFDAHFGEQLMSSLSGHIRMFETTFRFRDAKDKIPNNDFVTRFIRCLGVRDKLEFYEQNLTTLVGSDWYKFSVGKKLSDQIASIKQKYLPEEIFNEFLSEVSEAVNQKKIQLKGKVLKLSTRGSDREMALNFDPKVLNMRQNVLFFQNMGFKVPVAILLEFQRFDKALHAIQDINECLTTTKRVFNSTKNHKANFTFLVENDKVRVIKAFEKLSQISWEGVLQAIELSKIQHIESGEDTDLSAVLRTQDLVNTLATKTNALAKLQSYLEHDVYHALKICSFDYSTIQQVLQRLESTLFDSYGDLSGDMGPQLNDSINSELTKILSLRCEQSVEAFAEGLALGGEATEVSETISILFNNQTVELKPSLPELRERCVNRINQLVHVVEEQKLLNRQPLHIIREGISSAIARAFQSINKALVAVNEYHQLWCRVDFLTGLDVADDTDVGKFASESLDDWLKSMKEVVKLRILFDSENTRFGSYAINLEQIKSKTYAKFDIFQKQIAGRFGEVYQTETQKFLALITRRMNSLNFDTMNSKDFVENLNVFINTKEEIQGEWKQKLELFSACSNLFPKFGFQYPSKWIHIEQVDAQVSATQTIIDKKALIIEENKEFIESRVIGLTNELSEDVTNFKEEWTSKRPISGDMNPVMVLNLLSIMSGTCSKYFQLEKNLSRISTYLDFELPSINVDILQDIQQEVSDFKQVWSSINSLHDKIQQLRKLQWQGLKVKDIRLKLEALLEEGRSLPIKVRQYAAFEDIQHTTKNLMKQQKILVDLKNDNLKERHWKKLLALIGHKGKKFQQFTLGDIYDLNLPVHENSIKTIISEANNEHTLEESIDSIKERWAQVTFEYFNFNDKYKLIRSWDQLFEFCSQDLNELASMRNSSSYDTFEQQINQLEAKLNSFYSILDTWIEVQRQWVYLHGMFSSSNISNILPVEATRFNNLTYGFFTLMKKVYKLELAMDVLLISEFDAGLEKLSDSFIKLRRSLSEFLERQRESFGRFYFIGNEDLLELIGAGSDFTRINNHVNKLFSGISSLVYETGVSSITAVCSAEAEVVKLREPVSLIKSPSLVDWLKNLELEIKLTLASSVRENIAQVRQAYVKDEASSLVSLLQKIPSQVLILCCQVVFTELTESGTPFELSSIIEEVTKLPLDDTAGNASLNRRRKENLLVELIHQGDVSRQLRSASVSKQAVLSKELLYYFDPSADPLRCLTVKQMNNTFVYGLEYLGVPEKLVHTPLIDKCYLAMTQALSQKLGGSPFGPAGTGKTESVKSLGDALGKMVTVFCCDDSFDFQAMSRIFLGLCKTGCWGCFDEFNRLDEKLLSAVSSQIETIQVGLKNQSTLIELSGKSIYVNPETGIFVTMNPGYVGRNELPENLKKLFRSFSMDKPDKEIIAEVLLASQGFKNAKPLSSVIVPLFTELEEKCSPQAHYDFGLRSLRSAIDKCGRFIGPDSTSVPEESIVLQSVTQSITPKLIKQDKEVFTELKQQYFPGIVEAHRDTTRLLEVVDRIAVDKNLENSDNWREKLVQLYELQESHHGVIMVGSSGSGKSTCRSVLLEAMSELKQQEFVTHVIDAKVLSKEKIYGSLDSVTREWTDGLFTSILRKIRANLRGEQTRTSWIVFDGDIDPEWAENLNSVLDDNKILTLPNGERLDLPDNVRIIFETDSLKYTTLATISRCGMIWFDGDAVSYYSVFCHQLSESMTLDSANSKSIRGDIRTVVTPELLDFLMIEAERLDHIMDYEPHRAVGSFVSLILSYFRQISEKDLDDATRRVYLAKSVLLAAIWSFAGDSSLTERAQYGCTIAQHRGFREIEEVEGDFIDYDCDPEDGSWIRWNSRVTSTELEPHKVADPSTVIHTTDTVRHESLIHAILNEHQPLLLCGPPGSGKTMIFLEVLKKSPNLDVLQLNFSKDSSPELLMKSLMQHCEYQRSSNTIYFAPKNPGKWVVVFCDEINLPGTDKYECQTVISLMRQLVEHKGFWNNDKQWVTIKNIQFVGACNSPKDPGRQRLPDRFLRHVSLVMVDYPGRDSLEQIYETFNSAVMKLAPDLRGYSKSVTKAMLDVYFRTKEKFTPEVQSHYIYSPRELTRWTRGLLSALKRSGNQELTSFLRLWYHEGLRLFYDRLVKEEERSWTKQLFAECIKDSFPFADIDIIMQEPVLFSDWLSSHYESVDKESLYQFISHRLATFSEEEFDVELVLYQDLLTHALRIDRVLRQPQGHMILTGDSTSGKTTLTKFVAWINGLKVVQLQVYSNYTIADFDANLRDILLRCAKGEEICFLIDEASIIETSFIERMNTLLANSEIPGLFEGDDFKHLMNICLEESQAQGLLLDSNEELYQWFSQEISRNLHVVFTITNIADSDRLQVISSPALFNRCVLSFMGDWSLSTLTTVGSKKLQDIPVDVSSYVAPDSYVPVIPNAINGIRDALLEAFISVHKSAGSHFPGHFLSLVEHFIAIFTSKQSELEENQRHTTSGLNKLRETVLQVSQLKEELSKKQTQLAKKDQEAREMLNTMLSEQNEAERKQEFSITAQEELTKQEKEIENRRKVALQELEEAEPAIISARRGVQNIKKQHLTEIRSMANPPAAVKMTMESVCILVGYEVSTWRDVQLAIRKDDFIPNIVNYDNETQLTSEIRRYMEETYLSRPDFNFETVNRASKACGPLLQWVRAQLSYSSVLNRVGPLKEEVEILEKGVMKTRAQVSGLQEMVKELEVSIEKYKTDYSSLIRETENIKMEMESVEKKVAKSGQLMESLQLERSRWKKATMEFNQQNEQVIGSSVLAAGFLVYCGSLEKKDREILLNLWKSKLKQLAIAYEETISVLSLFPEETKGLVLVDQDSKGKQSTDSTSNELYVDNAVIFTGSRIPLVVDPTSKAIEQIEKLVPKSKYVATSFLADSFIKDLENAIRFGGSVLIKDFEHYNPILDAVLRNEIHRNGGRQMITIGDRTLDYNPNFKMFLHTRDPHISLSPFISSRVTLINFSTTSKDLEAQVLNLALKFVEPETEAKRSMLLYSQSQNRSKLKSLEGELLNSLAEVQGNILDNDTVIHHLETLKQEAGHIDDSMKETIKVLETIEEIRNRFSEVAIHCSLVFDLLKRLGQFSVFYDFSIETFKQIFVNVLKRADSSELKVQDLYRETFAVIAPSLKDIDKIVLAGWLCFTYYSRELGDHFISFANKLWQELLAGGKGESAFKELLIDMDGDVSATIKASSDNEVVKVMSGVITTLDTFDDAPADFIKAIASVCSFLFSGTGSFSSSCNIEYFLQATLKPLLLVSVEGCDPTFKIEQLAAKEGVRLDVVSLGSREGIDLARKELQGVSTRGGWLLIQNIQMSPEWLNSLEQMLASVTFTSNWRLFLSCGLKSKIPTTLISSCQVLVFEDEPSLQGLVADTFKYYSESILEDKPSEYRHLYFLLVWYHSVIVTRQSYVPASFQKKYDINDADFRSGLHAINQILHDSMKKGTKNIPVDTIPFEKISFVIGEVVYGGKVSHQQDFEYFQQMAQHLFSIKSFESSFNLLFQSPTDDTLTGPDGISVSAYHEWIQKLPGDTPLTWISLENDSDLVKKKNHAICEKLQL